MADMLHIIHEFGGVENLKGKKIAMTWAYSPSYGKPLSVPQGVVGLMTRFGMDVVLAHPEGYDIMPEVEEVAKKNITPPEVHISGYVDIKTFVPDGVDVIIEALKAAEDNGDEEEEISVQCVGAPRYRITVKSTDYILAEKSLKEAANRCIEVVEASDGNGSFLRDLE